MLVGTLKYLKGLPEARDDDLVMIVEGQDTWLQLQPELLIARYREVIRLSEDRLRSRNPNAIGDNVHQSIVFAAQK